MNVDPEVILDPSPASSEKDFKLQGTRLQNRQKKPTHKASSSSQKAAESKSPDKLDIGSLEAPDQQEEDEQELALGFSRTHHRNIAAFKLVYEGKLVNKDGTPMSMALCNITNNLSYSSSISTTRFPTLLQNTCLYDLIKQRALSLSECWVLQGFPHPERQEAEADMCGVGFPFSSLVVSPAGNVDEVLTMNQQRSVLGNGMHVAQVGAWVVYNVASVRFVAPSALAATPPRNE